MIDSKPINSFVNLQSLKDFEKRKLNDSFTADPMTLNKRLDPVMVDGKVFDPMSLNDRIEKKYNEHCKKETCKFFSTKMTTDFL